MSRILIAYATSEGQTGRISRVLAQQLESLGHTVQRADLAAAGPAPDPADYDGTVVAASVHAGQHQRCAMRYVQQHREALSRSGTAFLSISMSAACTEGAGALQAVEQAEDFLRRTGWRPPLVETVAGAMRVSQLSPLKRLGLRVMIRLFRAELDRLGWPADLIHDAEYTDWNALRGFGERFASDLPAAPIEPLRRAVGAD